MSRTDDGYAYWKEIPSAVKAAREAATLGIATDKLKAALLQPLVPVAAWLTNKLTRGRR